MIPLSIGIDYSLTCPCMCALAPSKRIEDCFFSYLTNQKKSTGIFCNGKIIGDAHRPYLTDAERYDTISEYFVKQITVFAPDNSVPICMEDYSFGSKGRVFNLAENGGVLKHKLWKLGYTVHLIAPSAVKKRATGKGNATKERMFEAAMEHGIAGIAREFGVSPDRITSPMNDIVDSFFVARMICNGT